MIDTRAIPSNSRNYMESVQSFQPRAAAPRLLNAAYELKMVVASFPGDTLTEGLYPFERAEVKALSERLEALAKMVWDRRGGE